MASVLKGILRLSHGAGDFPLPNRDTGSDNQTIEGAPHDLSIRHLDRQRTFHRDRHQRACHRRRRRQEQSRQQPDGVGPDRTLFLHGFGCGLHIAKETPAICRNRSECRGRTSCRTAECLHRDQVDLSGKGESGPKSGRRCGPFVEGEVLLGFANAPENRQDHLLHRVGRLIVTSVLSTSCNLSPRPSSIPPCLVTSSFSRSPVDRPAGRSRLTSRIEVSNSKSVMSPPTRNSFFSLY